MNLLNCNEKLNIALEGDVLKINTSSIEKGMLMSDKSQMEFLLNSTQEFNTLMLPYSYYELIRETYINTNAKKPPILYLSVSYSDIQGKVYNESIQISANVLLFMQNPDGSGMCVFNLISTKEKKTMNVFGKIAFNSDSLMVIVSICAVVISTLSMISTIIFSKLQVKHNKNSVKPISAIKLSDYEDKIAVKIQNVGTGPLIIKKLVFKNNSMEAPMLLAMMPKVDQAWSTFVESVDGWTIPVGGEIILLEICPESDEIKMSVRRRLFEITAFLEYVDIYNTKFKDTRRFEFFGRHFE